MKIYFCDICNESIPLQDLKDNLATTIKGKLFCQACNPLNTVTPSASSSKTAPWAVWALLVLLTGAVATLGYMVYELSSKDQSQSLTARIDGLVEKVDNVAANMTQAEVSLGERIGALPNHRVISDLERRMGQQSTKLEGVNKDLTHLRDVVVGSQDVRAEISAMELKQQEIGTKLAELQQSFEKTTEGLSLRLDEVLAEAAAGVSTAKIDSGAGTKDPATGGLSPELTGLVAELESKDAGKRWAAVDELAGSRDPGIIPHIIPLLNDPDAFVQIRVALALGDLSARHTVKHLVPLLRDSDPIVREEVQSTLIRLTGQSNLRFDVRASNDVRDKGVKKWESWWDENRDKF